jgi:hypothetical protein
MTLQGVLGVPGDGGRGIVTAATAVRCHGEPRAYRVTTVLACAALMLLASCTASTRSTSSSPASTHASQTSTARLHNRTTELSCTDANTSAPTPPRDGDQLIEGLTAETSLRQVNGLVAADVGLRVPGRPPLFFVKAPLYVSSRTPTTTIALARGSHGYLAWVPSRIWTGGGPIDLVPWLATTLRLRGCAHRPSIYLGGLLSTDPRMCLSLRVFQAGIESRTVRVGGAANC